MAKITDMTASAFSESRRSAEIADKKRARDALTRMKHKLAAMHGTMRVNVFVRVILAGSIVLVLCTYACSKYPHACYAHLHTLPARPCVYLNACMAASYSTGGDENKGTYPTYFGSSFPVYFAN